MTRLTLNQKMEIAYGIRLHEIDNAVTPKQRKSARFRLSSLAFWRDDVSIMLLTASLAIMLASMPWEPFSVTAIIGWFVGFLLIFVPVALGFTWLIMVGFHRRQWSFVRVFSLSFFLCLAFLCMMATYFP